jgi:hypothetical protein
LSEIFEIGVSEVAGGEGGRLRLSIKIGLEKECEEVRRAKAAWRLCDGTLGLSGIDLGSWLLC